jgi:Zn finger protein HypA/HybF involved in hydrogenase expression
MSERDELVGHAEVLRCDECGAVSADGRGWRALLTVGPEEAEDEDDVAVLCPDCASREFDL